MTLCQHTVLPVYPINPWTLLTKMAALELHIYGWKREDDGVPLSNYFLHAKMKSHSGLNYFLMARYILTDIEESSQI